MARHPTAAERLAEEPDPAITDEADLIGGVFPTIQPPPDLMEIADADEE